MEGGSGGVGVAAEERFDFEGKTYTVARLDADGERAFEAWMKGRAWAALDEVKAGWPERYPEALKATLSDLRNGAFKFGGVYFWESVTQLDGFAELTLLALKRHHPDAAPELVGRMIGADGARVGRLVGLVCHPDRRDRPEPTTSRA